MKLQSPDDLKDYCFRKLGDPVLNIEVDYDQAMDRIDDSVQMFVERHFDGTEEVYYKILTSQENVDNGFFEISDRNDVVDYAIVTEAGSGYTTVPNVTLSGTATAVAILDGDKVSRITITSEGSDYLVAPTVTIDPPTTGTTATASASLSPGLISIIEILEPTESVYDPLIDVRYQFMMKEVWDMASGSILHMDMSLTHLKLLNQYFRPSRTFTYNKASNRLYVNSKLKENNYFLVKGYRTVTPNDTTSFALDVYDDEWIKKYTTQLIKQQWGTNLKKFDGTPLPGGISMNGQGIYDEATGELEKLEEQFNETYVLPVDFMVG